MELIDREDVVAEIERREQKLLDTIICERDKEWAIRTAHQLNRIIMFIDNLEVKEVDLEKVFNDEYSKFFNDTDAMDYAFPIDLADFKDFAKHFFELGLKARKGE